MTKFVIMLAAAGMMSGPVLAQAAAQAPVPATNQIQPAQPQVVKKRVCQMVEDEDPYSRLGTRKICRTIEVREPAQSPANGQQPTNGQQPGNAQRGASN